MPRRLTREQKAAKRKKWRTSPRSRYGYHYRLDHELLTRCIKRGLGVRAIAKRMHTYVPCVRRLLKKHGLKLLSQPADISEYNEHNRRLHEQKLSRLKTQHKLKKVKTNQEADSKVPKVHPHCIRCRVGACDGEQHLILSEPLPRTESRPQSGDMLDGL